MSAAPLVIRDSLAAKQALRLHRFRLGALTYALGIGLGAIAWALGMLPLAALAQAAAAFLAINAVLYAVIRSGLNLRFRDPSLTQVQILVAVTALMFIVYHIDDKRGVALFACFNIFLFGVFRLKPREFVGVTLYTMAAYALVINLLLILRPTAIRDMRYELLTWLALAVFLPLFVLIGMQVNSLRAGMRASQARFRALSDMTSDYYWETDAEHRFTERGAVDVASLKTSVFQRSARMGERRWEVPSLTPDEAGWAAHRADLDAHRPFRGFELSRLAKDGTERHMSISGDPVFDAQGDFQGYLGVAVEITARKRSEQALRDNAESMRLYADSVPAMSASWDEDLRCRFANLLFTEFFGFSQDQTVGKHLRELAGPEVYREIEAHFAQVMQGMPATYERKHWRKGRELRYLEIKLLPQYGAQGKVLGCFEVVTDITEHKLAEKRIRRVANHDSLTGLPNKLLFGDRLGEIIAAARQDSRSFALLFLDLDRFKPVNDTLGHAAGDELLKSVARRIREQVRDSDTVARIGGDEFTVILPAIAERSKAEAVARKIVAALAASFELGAQRDSVSIGGSVGIALYPADGEDAEALLAAADSAMYRAKQGARRAS
ncbi:MAG: diguanylate cyclase [Usitatibacter sp.]